MISLPSCPAVVPLASLSDDEVIRRVCAGETSLFEVLMRRYNRRLYRAARAILRDDHEAEDVLQQTYLNAYTHLDQFARRASFATWLTRIAVYEALARRRRRGTLREADPVGGGETMPQIRSPKPDPEQQALFGELRQLLEASISALSDGYRSVFILREVEGLSTTETAECLDISEDTVKTRLHRARAMLRGTLAPRVGSVSDLFGFGFERCDRVVEAVLARLNVLRESAVAGYMETSQPDRTADQV